MTTPAAAFAIVKQRLTDNKPALLADGFRWQGEDGERLSDTPVPFAYVEFNTEPAFLAGFGGGLGRNLYRTAARVTVYLFVPRGSGMDATLGLAEELAAVLRSYRDNDISCGAASALPGGDGALIKPPGVPSEVGAYFFAVIETELTFDQVG